MNKITYKIMLDSVNIHKISIFHKIRKTENMLCTTCIPGLSILCLQVKADTQTLPNLKLSEGKIPVFALLALHNIKQSLHTLKVNNHAWLPLQF